MEIPQKFTTEEEKLKYVYRTEELLRLEHNENGAKFRDGQITEQEWKEYLKDFEGRYTNVLHERATLRDSLGLNLVSAQHALELIKTEAKADSKYDVDVDIKTIQPLKVELAEKANVIPI